MSALPDIIQLSERLCRRLFLDVYQRPAQISHEASAKFPERHRLRSDNKSFAHSAASRPAQQLVISQDAETMPTGSNSVVAPDRQQMFPFRQ